MLKRKDIVDAHEYKGSQPVSVVEDTHIQASDQAAPLGAVEAETQPETNANDTNASDSFCHIEMTEAVLRYPIGPYRRGSVKSGLMGLFGHRDAAAKVEYVTALRGIDLTITHGERVGIIGRNGSGKSSLLRALAGVYPLQSGKIHVRGSIGTLLDISLGFETESTGRENIYNRGFAMGLSKAQLSEHEADIIKFADLGEFIDRPMRTYSSGMFVRLGFAVSTHFTPDVLLVDEVFGAGDAGFARRAQGRMREITEHAGIVLMVSHDLGALSNNCDRVIWLDRGRILFDGPVEEAVDRYMAAVG